MPLLFTRTLRLKVRREAYAWLNAAAVEVNEVFNYCNETSLKAATRTDTKRKWMSGFDLCRLTAGASRYFDKIGADTIQSICVHYAQKRQAARRIKLRWRVSRGARRSLGWIPFKAASLKRRGVCLRFAGKSFRVFEVKRLEGIKWQGGCFAQDAVGDWWLCLPVKMQAEQSIAPLEAVGIDLGLKDIAVTSDEGRLSAGRWTREHAQKLASAVRRSFPGGSVTQSRLAGGKQILGNPPARKSFEQQCGRFVPTLIGELEHAPVNADRAHRFQVLQYLHGFIGIGVL